MTNTTKEIKHKSALICGEECEVYSRVTGYYRPVARWNHGKKEEFKERKTFNVATQTCSCKDC